MKNSILSRIKNSRLLKDILKLAFIITGCLVLASYSPSLDGRAVVVEPGVFPEGLFAKTVGYLPGDIISVTNITGDSTVDLLVIGALDPSEGVAIMLSPEAADAIGISRNANNIVKITKRSNQDERVYGSAVIATQNKESEPVVAEPAPVVSEPEPAFVEPEPATEYVAIEPEEEEAFEDFKADDVQEYEYEAFEENLGEEEFEEAETVPYVEEEIYSIPVEEEPEEEPIVEYDYVDDDLLPELDEEPVNEAEYIPGTEEDYEEEDFVEEEVTPEPEEEVVEPEEEAKEPEEEIPEEEPIEEEEFYEDYVDEGLEDLVEEETIEEEPAEEEVEEPVIEEEEEEVIEEEEEEVIEEEPLEEEFIDDEELPEQPAEDEEFVDEELEALEEEPVEEEPEEEEAPEDFEEFEEETEDFEEEDFEDEIIEEEPEPVEEFAEEPESFEDEVVVLDEEEAWEDDEEYDAIVLVPAEENPPAEPLDLGPYGSVTNTVVTEIEEEQFEEVIDTEIEVEPAAVVVQPVATGNETSYSKFMVESLNELEAEKYYIQIATLRDDENILEIVNKYGQKYPITIVPAANGAKQVLVGPVTLDEYGTVLARFKAYGYKDAFLRKGTNPNPKPKGSVVPDAK